jgi:16S rRNA (cytosine1407-C5)-methyltransferase
VIILASIGEVKRKLPDKFIDSLYNYFSPGMVDKILTGIASERFTTLRVNTLKYDSHQLMEYFKAINIKFERVQWFSDSFVIKNVKEREIEKLDIYKEGKIYIQSLPSMVPPLVLSPKPSEKVLDLTAAPGSKTTQVAALMQNKGILVANEVDPIRGERLKYNIKHQGADICEVIIGRGEKLYENYPEYFDRVLLDAPCSGEGRFSISDPKTYIGWSEKEVMKLSSLQKKLFESAVKALKRGGTLVYSTCTLNTEENEEILDYAVKNLGVDIIDTGIHINNSVPGFQNEYSKNVSKGIRILPSKDMEGFFVAKLKKNKY